MEEDQGGREVWELQVEQEVAGEVVLLLVRVVVELEGEEDLELEEGVAFLVLEVEEEGEASLVLEEVEVVEQVLEEEEEQLKLMWLGEPDSWDKAAESQSCVSCTPPSAHRPWTLTCGGTCAGWGPSAGGHSQTCSPSAWLCAPRSRPCPR